MLRALWWVALCAGVAWAQGRPARGLPPREPASLERRVLEVWDEGKRPEVLRVERDEVALEAQPGALLPALDHRASPSAAAGTAERVHLRLPTGELEVAQLVFPSPAAAEAYACFGLDLGTPALIERRGVTLVVLRGPALGQAAASAVAKLRAAAWAPPGGLSVAPPWALFALASGDGSFAALSRGEGALQAQLDAVREQGRSREGAVQWLDGERREVFVGTLGGRAVEGFSGGDRGSAVVARSWERAEGLKAFARQVLGRALPAAPEGVEPGAWILRHRKARLGDASPRPTPVLLTRQRRPSSTPTASEPAQTGLTEGLEQRD